MLAHKGIHGLQADRARLGSSHSILQSAPLGILGHTKKLLTTALAIGAAARIWQQVKLHPITKQRRRTISVQCMPPSRGCWATLPQAAPQTKPHSPQAKSMVIASMNLDFAGLS